jgi:hypothetical protein
LTQIFDFSALEAAWQAANRATAIYEMPTDPLLDRISAAATSKYDAAYAAQAAELHKFTAVALGPAAGLDKATRAALGQAADVHKFTAACAYAIQALDKLGALGSAAEISKCVAYADPAAGLDKAIATALGQTTRDALTVHSAIRDLVRRDGARSPYKQVLGAIRTLPDIDHLLAEGYRRPIFALADTSADSAGTVSNSPAREEMPAGPQTDARAWIAWERRYNTELLLLASLILIVLALLQWLDPQTAPAPSQPDPAVTSLPHGNVSRGSQKPSRNDLQSESRMQSVGARRWSGTAATTRR